VSASFSDLLGKSHSIARAELTLRSVKSAAKEGNIRLAVSRGITAIIHATAAAYKAPAPIVRKAEAIVQEVRDVIQGAVIKKATLGGLGARYEKIVEPSKYMKELRAKEDIEKRLRSAIEPLIKFKADQAAKAAVEQVYEDYNSTEEDYRPSQYMLKLRVEDAERQARERVHAEAEATIQNKMERELLDRFLEEKDRDWTAFMDSMEILPDAVDVATLIDRAKTILEELKTEQHAPPWFRLGRVASALTLFKAASKLSDPNGAKVIRNTYINPTGSLLKSIRESVQIVKQTKSGDPAVISIPTPGDPYAAKTINFLISNFGISERTWGKIMQTPDGMQIEDLQAAKEVLKLMSMTRGVIP
jgi:hypothetical protein